MAEKRMFTMKICDSDAFLDMPHSSQNLYFHLNLRADDDGFLGNPKRIQRLINASEDDLKLLLTKRFILAFESGVIVIKHWRMHNTIQGDRYKATTYQDELSALVLKKNKSYKLTNDLVDKEPIKGLETKCIQNDSTVLDIDLVLDLDKGLEIEKDIVQAEPKPYHEIINYLNQKALKKFKLVDSTKRLIDARLNENFDLDDFYKVIDNQCSKWLKDDKMNDYLRPQTLFGTKFESYLNSKSVNRSKTGSRALDMLLEMEKTK